MFHRVRRRPSEQLRALVLAEFHALVVRDGTDIEGEVDNDAERFATPGSGVLRASVGAPMLLFLTGTIGTARFGLVKFVNAFVNKTKVGIDFVDFG
jgi:hypothetical protein